ncbi:hypothetical protein I6F35_13725 [Bradyrhizobium sp. BRP22]|uniref:hypothetical protein n=1 Tax=Bradyrhizobium sp. BRP22 TaxID=2793821 RepID=UPI001CD47D08|nr:hypothetical protein [Bradyrhizobium sp. BRP22]MCA1454267.1 hypothetical protein [Bradyrhizobium sp. BRP22]
MVASVIVLYASAIASPSHDAGMLHKDDVGASDGICDAITLCRGPAIMVAVHSGSTVELQCGLAGKQQPFTVEDAGRSRFGQMNQVDRSSSFRVD